MKTNLLLFSKNAISTKRLFALLDKPSWKVRHIDKELALFQKCEDEGVDILLLDCDLKEGDDIGLILAVRNVSDLPIVVLSDIDNAEFRSICYESGADDIIPKPASKRELKARIQARLRAKINKQNKELDQEAIQLNGVKLDPRSRQVSCGERPVYLTSREFEVLHMLMRNAGNVISKTDLFKHALNYDITPCSRGVDVHVYNIRKKLSEACKGDYVNTVRGIGYLFLVGNDYSFYDQQRGLQTA